MSATSNALRAQAHGRVIAVNTAYIGLTGSRDAAMLLSQCAYWSTRTKDPSGWFYKSMKDWAEDDEGGWTRRPFDAAKSKLIELGVLKTELRGVPATAYYRIDFDHLAVILDQFWLSKTEQSSSLSKTDNLVCTGDVDVHSVQSSLYKTDNLVCAERTSMLVQNVQTISESTQRVPESTSESEKPSEKPKVKSQPPAETIQRESPTPPATVGVITGTFKPSVPDATESALVSLSSVEKRLYRTLRRIWIDIAHDHPAIAKHAANGTADDLIQQLSYVKQSDRYGFVRTMWYPLEAFEGWLVGGAA